MDFQVGEEGCRTLLFLGFYCVFNSPKIGLSLALLETFAADFASNDAILLFFLIESQHLTQLLLNCHNVPLRVVEE